jgi:hypothetical protein
MASPLSETLNGAISDWKSDPRRTRIENEAWYAAANS